MAIAISVSPNALPAHHIYDDISTLQSYIREILTVR